MYSLSLFSVCLCFPYCSGLSSALLNNQTWHIYRLFLHSELNYLNQQFRNLNPLFLFLPLFFPSVLARSLLHSPAQSAPALPAASALKAQQVTSSLSLWKVFVPWSPPKAASGPSFTLCPSSPHPQAPAWTLLLCDLSQMEPHTTPTDNSSSSQNLLTAASSALWCLHILRLLCCPGRITFLPNPLTILPSSC